MMKAAKWKRIVVFLDYDGTLSPIVDDPDRAFMSDEVIQFLISQSQLDFYIIHIHTQLIPLYYNTALQMRAAVREVAKYFPTAVISGRSRDKVMKKSSSSIINYQCVERRAIFIIILIW